MTAPRVIDLFCGAGGLSLGAHAAGFRSALAVDIDPDLTSHFTLNFPQSTLLLEDLSKLDPERLRTIVGKESIAGVVGGPPCQGFSEIGRRDADDPRNRLIGSFVGVVSALRPAFFLMENVPGLASKRNRSILQAALDQVPQHYEVLKPLTLDAADFGAATRRSRLVVYGYDPERVRPLTGRDLATEHAVARRRSVGQAISDIPEPESPSIDELPYRHSPRNAYSKRMRATPPDDLGSNASRTRLASGRVSGVLETRHTDQVRERFAFVAAGERDSVSRYPKLAWNTQAPVLRAGTGRDRGSYQAARPIHPREPRVITVREAARLQGFPDWFDFPPTKWHSHRMIGNSVSPIFAEALLRSVRSRLIDTTST